jgi:2',3'-cyclic-nucleotide 2'-phosphodiesterase / 3'-nucleotidase
VQAVPGETTDISLTGVPPFSDDLRAGLAHLRLLETTDLHVHVLPYDYYADRPTDGMGLSLAAATIARLRAEAANSLLFDNGDFLQGNPLGDWVAFGRGLKLGDLHPAIAAMNAAGFDAATLGNHEFNYGLDFLMAALERAAFPVVCANVALRQGEDPADDQTLLPPYVLLDRTLTDGAGVRHPIRVGVIGMVPPQILQWDHKHLHGRVTTRDIVAVARALVPRMRADGADIVVALSHSGIGPASHRDGMENATVPLAAVPGIDAVMAGHSHQVFPGPGFAGIDGVDAQAGTIHGKPAVMAGFWGSHVGVIDLLLERGVSGWRVASSRTAAHQVGCDGPEDAAVRAAAERDHAAALAYVRRPVGRSKAALHSYFALVADAPCLRIVNRAQAAYVAQALHGTPHVGIPVLSAAAPFRAGGHGGPGNYTTLPAGDIALRHVADLYPYPNTIRALRLSGAEIADWLERSASIFQRIAPGSQDGDLLDRDAPSYDFDVIEGLTWRIDLSRPAKYLRDGMPAHAGPGRVTDLCYQGAPLDPTAPFILATNSYRAGGGGAFRGVRADAIVLEAPDTNRDAVLRHITDNGTLDPARGVTWAFVPMPGTTVTFASAPQARAHLAEVSSLRIEDAGDAGDGFARFRIRL